MPYVLTEQETTCLLEQHFVDKRGPSVTWCCQSKMLWTWKMGPVALLRTV